MLNKSMIIGNLTKDVSLRYTQSGSAVASFAVATSEKYKDKDGNQVENTEYHSVTAWNKLAEICSEFLHKGSKVYIEGKLKTDKYTDQNGVEKYSTKIVASDMKLLSPRSQGDQQGQQEYEPPPGGGGNSVPF